MYDCTPILAQRPTVTKNEHNDRLTNILPTCLHARVGDGVNGAGDKINVDVLRSSLSSSGPADIVFAGRRASAVSYRPRVKTTRNWISDERREKEMKYRSGAGNSTPGYFSVDMFETTNTFILNLFQFCLYLRIKFGFCVYFAL